jgi:DNA polymerase-3 subunit gamma/tau
MAAREAIQPTRTGERPTVEAPNPLARADEDVRPDDETVDEEALGGAELLQRELGARIIEEIPNS